MLGASGARTLRVGSFTTDRVGGRIGDTGDRGREVVLHFDRRDISNRNEAIFHTDSTTRAVTMTNTRYSDIAKSTFVGVFAGDIRQSGNTPS